MAEPDGGNYMCYLLDMKTQIVYGVARIESFSKGDALRLEVVHSPIDKGAYEGLVTVQELLTNTDRYNIHHNKHLLIAFSDKGAEEARN